MQWPILCVIMFICAICANPKTRLFHLIIEQFGIYKNDKNKRVYWLDILTFMIMPILVALVISFNMSLKVIVTHAETIITVFSLIATLPLSYLALFIDKMLQRQKEKEV